MMHLEDKTRFSPQPYRGWTLCGKLVKTKKLVASHADCSDCIRATSRRVEITVCGTGGKLSPRTARALATLFTLAHKELKEQIDGQTT